MVLLHKILLCRNLEWNWLLGAEHRCGTYHWRGGGASWSLPVPLCKHYHHMLFSFIKNIFALGVLLTKNICTVLCGGAEDGTWACTCQASSPVSCASVSKRTHETGWTVLRKPEYIESNETITAPAWWRGDGCPKAKHKQSGVHRDVFEGHCLIQSPYVLQVRKS